MNRTVQSSGSMCKLIRIVELKIIKEGRVLKNVKDIYLRSENIPLLWKKFYMKIANERTNQYIRSKFMQHCRERHFLVKV